MKNLSKTKNAYLARILTTLLLSIFVLGSLSGCGKEEPGYQSSGGNNSEDSSEEYYPPDDYMTLKADELDYADEAIAQNFSVDGWNGTSPSSGNRSTEFSSVVGYWKAVMISDPESKTKEGTFIDYFNVEISGSPSKTSVTFNWNDRYYEESGNTENYLSIRAGHEGTFSNGSISASRDDTSIVLTDFWSDGEHQYAIGKYTWPDKAEGYIGLIR